MKKIIADYFSFSKKDRTGICILLVIITFIFFFPQAYNRIHPLTPAAIDTAWMVEIKKLEAASETSAGGNNPRQVIITKNEADGLTSPPAKTELFYFDPNTARPDEWKRLGLTVKTITTIQNYTRKGGQFSVPDDLKKIYGLRPDDYARILPYIRIRDALATGKKKAGIRDDPRPEILPPVTRLKNIDINTADTTAFISLPGIGSKLASRIVLFREKLGGFYTIEQIREVYGLADSVYQRIKGQLQLDPAAIKKIHINTATLEDLKTHPYLKATLATTLIAYRNEHGPFQNPEDVRKTGVFTEETYGKLAPYLTTQ